MEDKDITTHELEKEQVSQLASFSAFRKEEEFWRLKSLSLWLKASDQNTTFFHRQFRARLSWNHISKTTSTDGTVAKGLSQVKEAAKTHFQQLYTKDGTGDEEISNDFLSQIPSLVNEENNSNLMKPFTEEEINNVIWDTEPDKAPGLDGFSAHFYRACWTIIKSDLLRMAKIKPLLSKLISPNQGGFIAGRHILDNVILVQESMHSSHQRKEQGMLIKLDMTNTFDRVKLSFLYKVILSFGFSPAFVNLIKACTDKPWITLLVNGRPASYFQALRGIRQGCLLSPFLYIRMADTLSRKLIAERNKGTLPGIQPTTRLEPINHALSVDDSLLLGGSSPQIEKEFNGTLHIFCIISVVLINKRKNAVYSWNSEEQTTL
eukprot:PITA_02768